MTDIDKLKAAAEAATPGPWIIEPHGKSHALYAGRTAELHGLNLMYIGDGDGNFDANTKYIAAANPTAILSIIAEVERLRDALTQIAAYDDRQASGYLSNHNSYTAFDEPRSVELARAALEGKP